MKYHNKEQTVGALKIILEHPSIPPYFHDVIKDAIAHLENTDDLFSPVLNTGRANKIKEIKFVREMLHNSLKNAKELVERNEQIAVMTGHYKDVDRVLKQSPHELSLEIKHHETV